MHKQRSAYPALVAAVFILLFGGILSVGLFRRAEQGLGDPSVVLLVGCFSGVLAGLCALAAFSNPPFKASRKKHDSGHAHPPSGSGAHAAK